MDREMDVVSLVRMVFNACGKKEVEVKTAAVKPIIEIQFIRLTLSCKIRAIKRPDMEVAIP